MQGLAGVFAWSHLQHQQLFYTLVVAFNSWFLLLSNMLDDFVVACVPISYTAGSTKNAHI
jgi:hypothetical protein